MGANKGWERKERPDLITMFNIRCLDCGVGTAFDNNAEYNTVIGYINKHDAQCQPGLSKPPTAPQGMGDLVYNIQLRDLFAAAALPQLYRDAVDLSERMKNSYGSGVDGKELVKEVSRGAYQIADAMLEARKK